MDGVHVRDNVIVTLAFQVTTPKEHFAGSEQVSQHKEAPTPPKKTQLVSYT